MITLAKALTELDSEDFKSLSSNDKLARLKELAAGLDAKLDMHGAVIKSR
jgi:hypothetical protein